jgi:hypothetical protein
VLMNIVGSNAQVRLPEVDIDESTRSCSRSGPPAQPFATEALGSLHVLDAKQQTPLPLQALP